MAFYDLPKAARNALVLDITNQLAIDFKSEIQWNSHVTSLSYFSDEDTYIRKSAYLATGRLYFAIPDLQLIIIKALKNFALNSNNKVRQTVMNAAGEIAKKDFEVVKLFFDKCLFDPHHSVRNAVIGSVKKAGEVNPIPVLQWARTYLHHPDTEIRREICHGIELRGRKHPEDILPLLKELQFDTKPRVYNTLVHVLGQIAYKKDCLQKVITSLNEWENKPLVAKAIDEIIDVHSRYRNFSFMTQEEAKAYISKNAILH